MPRISLQRLALIGLLFVAAVFVYSPGLRGGFLFDDYVNLDLLGTASPLESVSSLLRYLTSGQADPLGRPVALLSFLLDARSWPADPAPFLRTNLALHLLNAGLLIRLLRSLGHALGYDPARSARASLLGAAMWLLHPLQVSTTMYVVQRESMLAATFVLLGLCGWLSGRERLLRGGGWHGASLMAASIIVGTALAALSKANGVLLPLLALVMDWVIRGANPVALGERNERTLRWLRLVLLLLPSAVLVLALLRVGFDPASYSGRGFSLAQRLWSEGRALADYLRLLYAPRVSSDGLFNDDFQASVDWYRPWTTAPCALFVLAMASAGACVRRRYPAWSLGLLFFFAAHLVESTVLPLELRFEHRNYLPAMLLFWPLADAIVTLKVPPGARNVVAIAILLGLGALTWRRSELWGHPDRLAGTWLASHPHSSRALAFAGLALRESGQPLQAVRLLGTAWADSPRDPQLALGVIEARCAAGTLQPIDLRNLGRTLASMPGDLLVLRWLDAAIDPAPGFACHLPDARLGELLDIVEANPAFRASDARQNIHNLRGRLALRAGDAANAEREFERSLLEDVRPEVGAAQAAMLIEAGYHREAMDYLDFRERVSARSSTPPPGMPRVHAWLLRRQGYWDAVFSRLRAAAIAGNNE